MQQAPLFLKGSRLVSFLLRQQNFTEIELRKNEIENASGGEEECVFRGLVIVSVVILTLVNNPLIIIFTVRLG